MSQHDPVLIVAGVVITLALFVLIGYVVRAAPPTRVAVVISAIGTVITAVPVIIYALVG